MKLHDVNTILALLPQAERKPFVAKLMKSENDVTSVTDYLNLFAEGERPDMLNTLLDEQVSKPAAPGGNTYNGTVNHYEIYGGTNNRIDVSYAGGGYASQRSSTGTAKQGSESGEWNLKGELVYLKDQWIPVIKGLVGDGKSLSLTATEGLKYLANHNGQAWGNIKPNNFMYVSDVATNIQGLKCVSHTNVKFASGPACFLTMKPELYDAAKAAGLIVEGGDTQAAPQQDSQTQAPQPAPQPAPQAAAGQQPLTLNSEF